MKPTHILVFCACSIFFAGCAYRGAVYSEYNQTALDIRASQASGAPVQVNFGYDRGVFAYVPKQNAETNSTQGEAVSVISWNNTATELNPTQTSSNSVLRADAGFISGIAADVASAPSNYLVNIVAPGLATNTVQTSGSSGARISVAATVFAPATIQVVLPALQARKIALQKRLSTFAGDGAKAKKILTDAGGPDTTEDKAVNALQAYIAETSTDDGIKKLEEAFNKNQ